MRAVEVRSICRALLVLDVGYCALAAVVPGLPGWKMFESSAHVTYSLKAGDGSDVDAYGWVPRAARDLDEPDVIAVARWLCRHHRVATPLTFDGPSVHRVIDAPDCVDHASQ